MGARRASASTSSLAHARGGVGSTRDRLERPSGSPAAPSLDTLLTSTFPMHIELPSCALPGAGYGCGGLGSCGVAVRNRPARSGSPAGLGGAQKPRFAPERLHGLRPNISLCIATVCRCRGLRAVTCPIDVLNCTDAFGASYMRLPPRPGHSSRHPAAWAARRGVAEA